MPKLLPVDTRILGFYAGTMPDDDGRMLADIQQWPDSRLEDVHDFIQWLFPLPEPSPVNPRAPVLDDATIAAFSEQANLRVSLERMLRFYGLELRAGPVVSRAPNFQQRALNWLAPNNHNHLRISRILRCCRLLGLAAEARAFLDALQEINPDHPGAITARSSQFWKQAVE
jgi:hypothetical protein